MLNCTEGVVLSISLISKLKGLLFKKLKKTHKNFKLKLNFIYFSPPSVFQEIIWKKHGILLMMMGTVV